MLRERHVLGVRGAGVVALNKERWLCFGSLAPGVDKVFLGLTGCVLQVLNLCSKLYELQQ